MSSAIRLISLVLLVRFTLTGYADPFDRWTWRNPLPTGDPLIDIAFGNGQFVAVGTGGTILISSDGISWSQVDSGTYDRILAIAYGNRQFVAIPVNCGEGECISKILMSADGFKWSQRDVSLSEPFLSIAFGNDHFVVLGAAGTALTSADGTNWLAGSVGISEPFGLAYGGGQFVAAGLNGITSSADGIEWVQGYSDPNQYFFNVAYAGSQFWAMGSVSPGVLLTSADGINWTNRAAISTNALYGISYAGGKFFAWDGDSILTSADGVAWAKWDLGSGEIVYGITYADGKFVAWGNGILTSTNGLTWTGNSIEYVREMVYGNGQFVAIGDGLLSSTDATNWVQRLQGPRDSFLDIAYGNGRFVAISEHYNYPQTSTFSIFTSTNGATWAQVRSETPGELNAIIYANGEFVAIGDNCCDSPWAPMIFTSPDGMNWDMHIVQQDDPTEGQDTPQAITYGNGRFLAIGLRGKVFTSPDGVNWLQRKSPELGALPRWQALPPALAFGNGQFVAAGRIYEEQIGSEFYTSTDGLFWTQRLMTNNVVYAITFANGRFVAMAGDNDVQSNSRVATFLTSSNGLDWTRQSESVAANYGGSVAYGNGYFVAPAGQYLFSSRDGMQWIPHAWPGLGPSPGVTPAGAFSRTAVAYGDGHFVVVGGAGMILESDSIVNLSLAPLGSRQLLSLSITGPRQLPYVVESSTNLVTWQQVTNLPPVNAPTQTLEVLAPTNGSQRVFYRANSH